MVVPFQVVDRVTIGRAATIDGRVVTVSKVQFDKKAPGMKGDTGYTVDVSGRDDVSPVAVGFATEKEAFNFVTSMDTDEYSVVDTAGNSSKIERTGLGVPAGMLVKTKAASFAPVAPAVESPVPPDAAQFPEQAAALNAPPDANRAPHGNQVGEGGGSSGGRTPATSAAPGGGDVASRANADKT